MIQIDRLILNRLLVIICCGRRLSLLKSVLVFCEIQISQNWCTWHNLELVVGHSFWKVLLELTLLWYTKELKKKNQVWIKNEMRELRVTMVSTVDRLWSITVVIWLCQQLPSSIVCTIIYMMTIQRLLTDIKCPLLEGK